MNKVAQWGLSMQEFGTILWNLDLIAIMTATRIMVARYLLPIAVNQLFF